MNQVGARMVFAYTGLAYSIRVIHQPNEAEFDRRSG